MTKIEFQLKGAKELKRAIKRNPAKVAKETRRFLNRGLAIYKRGIRSNPWTINASGGGVPIATGNLRDTHITQIKGFQGVLYPVSTYAKYVHEGTSRMKPRPWLDFVQRARQGEIEGLADVFLHRITKDLAK